MKVIAETPRLFLREFILDDSSHFYQMNADKEVVRFTGDAPFPSQGEALRFLEGYRDYERFGIGRWAVIRKTDDKFLGWCGLKYHPDESITDVGYRFYREYWGEGYATEAARAALNFGFQNLKLFSIHAHAHVDNSASIRVLEKLGLRYQKEVHIDGMPASVYRIDNPDYTLKKVSDREVLPLRHRILRAGRPFEEAVFEGDTDQGTFHLGVFYLQELVAVVTMMKRSSPRLLSVQGAAYQLRGMAVMEDFRKRGVGKAAVEAAEVFTLKEGGETIWMNAREGAASFYTRLGYQPEGGRFEIPGVGPHFFMKKSLVIK